MKYRILILTLAIFVLSLSMVVAAPLGASTTEGASTGGSSTSTSTANQDAGNISYVDVASDIVATGWAGFFGNLSGSFFLSDASANNMYRWTLSTSSGAVVYASNSSISDWSVGNIGPLLSVNVPSWVNDNTTSGFNNTFTATETFNSSGYAGGNEIANVPYVATFNGSGVAGELKTYALFATNESATIWAGKVIDDTSGFNSNTLDYQILLPAQTGTTYTFYTELV